MDPVTRRTFIKGVIAAGAAATSAAYLFRGPGALLGQTSAPGVGRAADHAERQRAGAPRRRHEAGNAGDDAPLQAGPHRHQARVRPRRVRRLHGAHRRRAALLLLGPDAHRARAPVVTIEGLASATGELHPMQRGVVDEQGFQCAFCMPGFVMSAVGFLKVNPNPTREELAHGVSGNLCRCQDYDKILTVADEGRGVHAEGRANGLTRSWSAPTTCRPTSSRRSPAAPSTRRTSAPTACSSPSCSSARCRTRASAASTPARRSPCRASRRSSPPTTCRICNGAEKALTNEPLYAGEPILAVAAVDEVTAADAIERIVVDFEPLPFVVDPLESLRPGSPNARLDGNVWSAPRPPAPGAPGAACPRQSARR